MSETKIIGSIPVIKVRDTSISFDSDTECAECIFCKCHDCPRYCNDNEHYEIDTDFLDEQVKKYLNKKPIIMKTNLIGFKNNCFRRRDLSGFFTVNGRELTDHEIRKMVNYGIAKGYRYDTDIPDEELRKILNWK